jgi:hypothetical protein
MWYRPLRLPTVSKSILIDSLMAQPLMPSW